MQLCTNFALVGWKFDTKLFWTQTFYGSQHVLGREGWIMWMRCYRTWKLGYKTNSKNYGTKWDFMAVVGGVRIQK